MSIIAIISIPIISALIGWFTNWIAIKMLFYPREEKNFLLFKFQGIFPRHQAEIAVTVGQMVANELLSAKDLKEHLSSPEHIHSISTKIEDKIDQYLNVTFPEKHPVIGLFFGDKRKAGIKEELLVELEKSAPDIIQSYLDNIEHSFDIADIITKKVAALEVSKLEDLMLSILSKEFAFVEWIGGVIGFIIGLLQVGITFMQL